MKTILYLFIFLFLSGCIDNQISSTNNSLLNIGWYDLQQGDYPSARMVIYQVWQANPDSMKANLALAMYWQAVMMPNNAFIYFKKALLLAPENPEVLDDFGSFLCQQGHYVQGLQYVLQAANMINYANAELAWQNAAICARLMNHFTLANTYTAQAKKLAPNIK